MAEKEGSIFKALFLTITLIAIIVVSTVIVIKHFGLRLDLSRLLSGNKVYEVTKASKNLPISREPYETIDLAQIVKLRQMIQEEQFEQLNAILEEYQNIFEEDQTNEYKVYDAYRTFYITIPSYEEFFKNWVNTCSDSYQPYLAIAQYYYARGWESRGYQWGKDTLEEQFEGMRFYFSKAEENVKFALKINPNLMVGYDILVGINNANGNDKAEDRIIQKASELFPYSFLIRSVSSWAKEPRWGGSYMLMEEIAKESEKYSNSNPKLTILYGFIYYDQGRILKRQKKYEEAIDLFSKALSFGDHWSFYYERAKIYHFNLKEYDRALEEINRSMELRPTKDDIYRMRSRIYFAKENYIDSIKDLHTAESLRPGDPDSKQWKEWASKNFLNKGHILFKTDLNGAIENYNLSLEFDDKNFDAYYWRGDASCRLKNFDSALSDFKIAIEINPRHFDSYRMIDFILARDQKWDTIIDYWNRFLELEPDHSGAYLERAGTHYHNKDFENALNDLEKSCQLGNETSCERYRSLKEKI